MSTRQGYSRGKEPLVGHGDDGRPQPHSTGYNQGTALKIPGRVAANGLKTPKGAAWLDRLPEILGSVERRWSLTLGAPFDNEEVSCGWVALVALADGTSAVLMLGMPHSEEIVPVSEQRWRPSRAEYHLPQKPDSSARRKCLNL